MKLEIAIINNDDSAVATAALTAKGLFVTKLSTTGGFLMVGNTTLLIGVDDDKVGEIREVLNTYCKSRVQTNPTTNSFGRGLYQNSVAEEVVIGGAIMFVLSVDSMEKFGN